MARDNARVSSGGGDAAWERARRGDEDDDPDDAALDSRRHWCRLHIPVKEGVDRRLAECQEDRVPDGARDSKASDHGGWLVWVRYPGIVEGSTSHLRGECALEPAQKESAGERYASITEMTSLCHKLGE